MNRNIAFILLACAVSAQAVNPLWMRDVKISPQGDRIAFTYRGDIYTVASTGGKATRLTTDDAYHSNPIWSPDGSLIAFASNRHGNDDIYIMPSQGGVPQRLTTHSANETPQAFTPDGKFVQYSAYIQDPASSATYPSGLLRELYQVPVGGGSFTQVEAAPMQSVVYSPDGSKIYYHYCPGMENEWRKHHTSSVTGDIWVYDTRSRTHTNLTNRPGEDRYPALSPDGKILYFLSERDGGSANVYAAPLSNPADAAPLTHFATHPVRFLSSAANGLMAFNYDGAIYTMTPGEQPRLLDIEVTLTDPHETIKKVSIQPAGGAVSPDGKQLAFTSRGEVLVTSVEYPTTKRITNTAANERELTWGADNRTLYYTSNRDGYANIYRAEIASKDDPDFPNATLINETRLFDDDGVERSYPDVSPDGKKLAYIQNRNQLMVRDLKSGKTRQVTDGSTYARRNGGFSYTWAPDSRWIALEVIDNRHDPYSDIALIDTEDGTYVNLTQSAYINENPRFVLDGNAVIYTTDQYGLRSQASWGSQNDYMITFLNREAYDRFKLNEEDAALAKEADKAKSRKKDDAKNDSTDTSKSKKKELNVEIAGIHDRTEKLTPFSAPMADAFIDASGENLYFLAEVDKGYDIWKMNLRKREPRLVNKASLPMSMFAMDKTGKTVFILGSQPKKFATAGDKLTPITARGTLDIDVAAERDAMLTDVWKQEKEMFYRTDMHGVDWDAMVEHYRQFLPHIDNNNDYADLLSELLGELNVSHTGGRYRPGLSGNSESTSTLGLLYDMTYDGRGMKVDEIIVGGPFDNAATAMAPGAIVTAVNGTEINAETNLADLFNGLAGKKTLITFKTPGGKVVNETIKPITTAAQNNLLYKRWVDARAEDVRRWSNGRLGYVHIPSMNDASFRPMYSDLLGKYNECEGVVIDIRFNGGGRMHEDIEQLFSGSKYFTQVIRGVETCDMPSRRWNKPSIMVQCEACYSNAHGTPWVYQHQGLGKLVGMPVAGTMTSVNWIRMQDPTLVYGIPVVGYQLPDGSYLENTQLYPDVTVDNDPTSLANGEDLQLRTAVETLLKDIDNAKK